MLVHAGVSVTILRIASVLAPLFVHYEILFMLGFLKQTKRDLQNDVGRLRTVLRLGGREAREG